MTDTTKINDLVESIKSYKKCRTQTEYTQYLTNNDPSEKRINKCEEERYKIVSSNLNMLNTNFSNNLSAFNTDKQNLYRDYKDVLNKRNDLDSKMNELISNKDTISSEYKMIYDTSIYTNILWTALATSILYYTFIQISK